MLAKKVEVKTYQYTAHCSCGGEYIATGIVLTSNPPQYPHECNKCGDKQTVRGTRYPYVGIEKILT